MIKLKKLLKESTWANRKFGEALPTMKDYKVEYDKKQQKLDSAKQHLDDIQQDLDDNLQKMNETLPAFAKQWKGLEKAEKIYTELVNMIEIWDKTQYESVLKSASLDFADLAEEVMGGIQIEN